jgi:ribonuclease P protein 1
LKEERNFKELSVDSFSELLNNKNNEIKDRIESILMEYEYQKYTTLCVPTTLTVNNMTHLLMTTTPKERIKLFKHLLIKEIREINRKIDRKQKSDIFWAQKRQKLSSIVGPKTGLFDSDANLIYGLWHNSLLTKLYPKHVKRLYNNRLRTAALFGQTLVLDLDCEQYMTVCDSYRLANQIISMIAFNKYHREDPFDIQFANCRMNGLTLKTIQKSLDNCDSQTLINQFNTKSYLDLYPTQRLVYISPFAQKPLDYNLDDIYIIGTYGKKISQIETGFVKAKKEGLRMARIPIDEHLLWRSGSKNLSISRVVSILHEVRLSGDWNKALKENIPIQRQKTIEEVVDEDYIRMKNFQKKINLKNNY